MRFKQFLEGLKDMKSKKEEDTKPGWVIPVTPPFSNSDLLGFIGPFNSEGEAKHYIKSAVDYAKELDGEDDALTWSTVNNMIDGYPAKITQRPGFNWVAATIILKKHYAPEVDTVLGLFPDEKEARKAGVDADHGLMKTYPVWDTEHFDNYIKTGDL